MFTNQKNNILIFAFIFTFLFVFTAKAQDADESDLKSFLKDSEFALQREVIKSNSLGQKGLLSGSNDTSIREVLTVDLIDPFANKTIEGTKIDSDELDDGIEFRIEDEVTESLNSFRAKIEEYFTSMEKQENIDIIELINSLKINRIVSSPDKFVYILNKKYKQNDIIKVKVNRLAQVSDFENMLNSVTVKTNSSEESELLEQMKEDAKKRYDLLVNNNDIALNIVKIKIEDISKHSVRFSVDDKKYTVKLNN